VTFLLIWATAAGLDAVAEPQAIRPEAAALAATVPSRGGFAGEAGDGASREMIACAAAVVTLVVLIAMVKRGDSDGGSDKAKGSARP
jgi:hypothetical protein